MGLTILIVNRLFDTDGTCLDIQTRPWSRRKRSH